MKSSLDVTWQELSSSPLANQEGILTRQIGKLKENRILLGITAGQRCFILRLNVDELKHFNREFNLKGIILKQVNDPKLINKRWLVLLLTDNSFQDIFSSLCLDIIKTIEPIKSDKEILKRFISRLVKWQTLFEKLPTGIISLDAQKGLFGELYFLRKLLLKEVNLKSKLVSYWQGSSKAVQDFQGNRWAVEVKATSSKKHQKIHIANERQLDDSIVEDLYLYVISIDIRPEGGENLNQIVASISSFIGDDYAVFNAFQEKLLEAGYLEAHNAAYNEASYIIRKEYQFKVEGEFPRLTENTIPNGVGDVAYSINISNCQNYSLTETELFHNLH